MSPPVIGNPLHDLSLLPLRGAPPDSSAGSLQWSLVSSVALGVLALWLVVEVLFYVWYVVALRKAQARVCPPRMSLEDREFLLHKMLMNAEDYGMWRQIKGWFLTQDRDGTHSPHEVGSEDLLELLSWAFFYKRVEDLDAEEISWVEFSRRKICEDFKLDQSLKPGRTGVIAVRHTLDQVHAIHRPLFFYMALQAAYALHGLLLRARGFRRGTHKGLRYWYRLEKPRADESQGEEPLTAQETETLIFFHGIGLGLLLYLPLLMRLRVRNQILFEMPWIAMNPFAEIPSSTDYAQWVVEALRSHTVERCVALGHSFGSLPISWLIRQHPSQVTRCVLVDPVCIFLNLPDVCVNFLYKRPRTLFGKMMRVFGAREFGIAKTLMRHFFWTDNVLFPEQIPEGSSVVLMGNDRILPVKEIYTSASKLTSLRTEVIPNLDHGNFLFWPSACSTVLAHVDECLESMRKG